MRLSDRSRNLVVGGSDGWDVYYRARKMLAAGEKVVMLTIGDHDTPTPPEIIDAMAASARAGHTGYAVGAGLPKLREAIARRIAARTGEATAAENVVVTPGGQAALFAAFMTVLDPGDRAVIVDPYYATYPQTVRAVSGVVSVCPARAENGFQIDAADLDRAAEGARALLINTPHNPTGVIYGEETLAGIAEVCRRRDLWLISDEVYEAQVHEGRHVSPRTLPGMRERTIVVGSMSKSHVMTGFRLGWMAGPREVAEAAVNLGTATTYGVPAFIQHAALHGLEQGGGAEAATTALYDRRRRIALDALRGANGIHVVAPQGGMYVVLDVRATGMSGIEFADRLLDAERIAVMPGESFGEAAAGHLRVALTVDDAALADALRRIAAFAGREAA